jgi:L-ascorbate metabolism protein UlaG (beta-lactamase superfamily)
MGAAMKVTTLFQSGALVELEGCALLFDYYKGELPPLPREKDLFVFVSHGHPDHYNPVIWDLKKQYPKTRYILFEGVADTGGEHILQVTCPRKYSFGGLDIETLVSTDEGCAFVVEAEGRRIYHAGDLNWWHWEGEPEETNRWHEQAFRRELARLAGRHFHCAFLPLDPRQEANAWWGFVEVLKAVTVDAVFPIHYGRSREEMLAYLSLPQLAPYRDRIVTDRVKIL